MGHYKAEGGKELEASGQSVLQLVNKKLTFHEQCSLLNWLLCYYLLTSP